jgi:hypothetical protein
MTSTFDEEEIIQSITYKCITRLEAYNEVAAYKVMPLLNYCPPTCLITSVVVRNSYYLEYTLMFNDEPIIPQTVVENDINIWFNSIIPYNVSTQELNFYLVFFSPITHVLEVETTIITFNPSYYYTLITSASIFTDTFLNITCTLDSGNLTLEAITPLTSEQITNVHDYMHFASGKYFYQPVSLLPNLGLFQLTFKTVFVTDRSPHYVGTLVINPEVDVIKSIFVQTYSYELEHANIAVSYQEVGNVISTTSKISSLITFSGNLYLNLNTNNTYQLTVFASNTIPIQKFLCSIEQMTVYAEGDYVSNEIKANNYSNVFINLD